MLHIFTGSTQRNRASDPFRLREAYEALRRSLDSDGMLGTSTSVLEPRGLTPSVLVQHLSTVPFLAAARLVVVEGLITQAGGGRQALQRWQPLLDALPELPETNHLVLLEPAIERDHRDVLGRSPLLRALRAMPGADVQSFEELRLNARRGQGQWVNEVAEWTQQRAAARGIELAPGVAELLSELIGGDLWALAMELDKLATYAQGRPVTQQDVRALTAQAREEEIFALVDAVAEGRTADALQLARRRVDGGESIAGIRAMIARQVRALVRTAEVQESGGGESEVGAATRLSGFPLRKAQQQARALGRLPAEAALRALEQSDYDVKTGAVESEALALDLLLTDLGRIAAGARPAGRAPARRGR